MTARRFSIVFPLLLLLAVSTSSGCFWKYKFVPGKPLGKTITIDRLENEALVVVPTLSQDFTEALRDRFISQTNLQLISSGGDLHLSGNITNYNVAPIAIQGNETAASNRLTISVKIKYENANYPEQNFDQSFSNFADFDSGSQLSEVESALIKEINDKITQDVFNKVLANW
jgi:Lipopolysaccharide-assembly